MLGASGGSYEKTGIGIHTVETADPHWDQTPPELGYSGYNNQCYAKYLDSSDTAQTLSVVPQAYPRSDAPHTNTFRVSLTCRAPDAQATPYLCQKSVVRSPLKSDEVRVVKH
jgi:hypothetical protein